MRRAVPRLSNLAVALGVTSLFAIGYPAQVRAQTQTIFCPATFGSGPGQGQAVFLSNGSCTNGSDGAFSGAALASQALSELSQTTTQTNTKEIGKAIVERREQERERMSAPCAQRAKFRGKSRRQLRSCVRSLHRLRSNPADLGPGFKSLAIIRRGTLLGLAF
jgi:hypothetical protein